jgi:hypothetical protein
MLRRAAQPRKQTRQRKRPERLRFQATAALANPLRRLLHAIEQDVLDLGFATRALPDRQRIAHGVNAD